ncbi:MAG: TrmH family RNA methyltransferase [Treponema sp.]
MLEPEKLFQLTGGQKRRKLALTFGSLERDIAGIAEKGHEYAFKNLTRRDYTKKLAEILLKDPKLSPEAAAELKTLLTAAPFDELRVCNCARNHLLALIGTFPAEWDLVIAPHSAQTNKDGAVKARDFYKGVCVYAEDIRSPFNLGSIFRTAEGMGAEKLYISPFCVDPMQARSQRSAMGCIETLSWERTDLNALPEDAPVFALETGGVPIEKFKFPKEGICIIGSEELGCSPEALKRARYGRVSIPMKGLKASLNVGVAFGILMQKWREATGVGETSLKD